MRIKSVVSTSQNCVVCLNPHVCKCDCPTCKDAREFICENCNQFMWYSHLHYRWVCDECSPAFN